MFSVPGGMSKDISGTFLAEVLRNESNDTKRCLLKDCIKVFLCKSGIYSPYAMKLLNRSVLSNPELGFCYFDSLSIHNNFLAYIVEKCLTLEDYVLVKDVISHAVCFEDGNYTVLLS